MDIESNALRPEPFEDKIDRGFAERDSLMMIEGLLALTDEKKLADKMKLLAKGFVDRRGIGLALNIDDPLHQAADYDLLRLGDLLRSLDGKPIAETRAALEEYKRKERAVRTAGFARSSEA